MTQQEMQALIEKQQAEIEALKAKKSGGNGIKVSPKGAVSVYGLGRFPVTLYASQWEALIAKTNDITKFIAANGDRLTRKES